MLKLKSTSDLGAGLFFLAIGAVTTGLGLQYQVGSVARMGPGFFPVALGLLLALLGCIITVQSFALEGPPIGRWPVRSLLLVLVSVVVFGLLLPKAGLIVAIAALILISGLAAHDLKFMQLLALLAFLTAFSIVVFVYGLRLDLSVWPSF